MQPGMMPPGMMPPPGMPGFGPFGPRWPKPRWGFLRLVLGLFILVLLLDLVGLNLLIIGALTEAATGVQPTRQVTLVNGSLDQVVASIPVGGLITDATAEQFDQFMTTAQQDRSVKAVVLEIDTPGGSATASDAMYHRIQRFRAAENAAGRNVPVIVSMGGMATSGGYYVACSADFIFAEPTTLTANIGVLFPRFNVSSFINQHGVTEETIVATGCDYKNLGSMFKPEDPKALAYLQGLVDQTFDQFKKVVSDGRHGKLPEDTSNIFNGRVYIAADALKLGLVDQIGYADDAYNYAKGIAKLDDMRVVRYKPPSQLAQMLSDDDSISNLIGRKAIGLLTGDTKASAAGAQEIDATKLSDLLAPRPMYLWREN
jgi:protease IV